MSDKIMVPLALFIVLMLVIRLSTGETESPVIASKNEPANLTEAVQPLSNTKRPAYFSNMHIPCMANPMEKGYQIDHSSEAPALDSGDFDVENADLSVSDSLKDSSPLINN